MRKILLGEGALRWFAQHVPGRPEDKILRSLPADVRVMGTRRLGLPHRDVDLFCLGNEVEQDYVATPCTLPGVPHLGWVKTTSKVTGIERWLQKVGSHTAEGRFITLTANPLDWYLAQDCEYAAARWRLDNVQGYRTQYLCLREAGCKREAYALLGIRYAEDRA